MPIKLNVGLSKKIGLPDYGSLGASCHVEIELAGDAVFSDLEAFQRQARSVFTACRQAVQDELALHSNNGSDHPGSAPQQEPGGEPTRQHGNGSGASSRNTNGNGRSGNGHASRASQKQLDYARQLAGQIRGLGVRRLETLAQKMFAKPIADLSTLDASGLIDTLKDLKAGIIDVDAALSGAAA